MRQVMGVVESLANPKTIDDQVLVEKGSTFCICLLYIKDEQFLFFCIAIQFQSLEMYCNNAVKKLTLMKQYETNVSKQIICAFQRGWQLKVGWSLD